MKNFNIYFYVFVGMMSYLMGMMIADIGNMTESHEITWELPVVFVVFSAFCFLCGYMTRLKDE